MSVTNTPNMNLPMPVVGSEDGPQYAVDVNSCFTLLDQHDHTPGKGVAITPSGININSALTFNNNFLTSVAGVTFTAQSSTPAVGTIYENGVDLYYVDGNGNNVRMTQGGNVAGSSGSISGLNSPASASYNSGTSTFIWQSNTGIAANMDAGALLMRNLSPNSTFALTLQPPAGLSSNYAITLPTLPLANAFLTIDTSGNVSASPALSGGLTHSNLSSSAGILGSQLSSTANINGSQLSASAGILPSQIDSVTSGNYKTENDIVSYTNSTTSFTTVTSVSPTIAVTTRPYFVNFGNDGSGASSIVVTGSNAIIQVQLINGITVIDTPIQAVIGPGSYPPTILNCITLPDAVTVRLQAKMSGSGSITISNTLMQVFQV